MKRGLAEKAYISLLCAEGYEDQVPESKAARWWHLLWFLIPIVGILIFIESIRCAAKEEQ
jgi:hypothetical protein